MDPRCRPRINRDTKVSARSAPYHVAYRQESLLDSLLSSVNESVLKPFTSMHIRFHDHERKQLLQSEKKEVKETKSQPFAQMNTSSSVNFQSTSHHDTKKHPDRFFLYNSTLLTSRQHGSVWSEYARSSTWLSSWRGPASGRVKMQSEVELGVTFLFLLGSCT